jgi:hypothetical protein
MSTKIVTIKRIKARRSPSLKDHLQRIIVEGLFINFGALIEAPFDFKLLYPRLNLSLNDALEFPRAVVYSKLRSS